MLHLQQQMGRHCLTMCDGGIVCRSVRLCRFSICSGRVFMPLVSCLGGLSTRFIHPCDSDFLLAALSCHLCLVLAGCPPLCAVILNLYWRLCRTALCVCVDSICIGGVVMPLVSFSGGLPIAVCSHSCVWRVAHPLCVVIHSVAIITHCYP